MRCDVCRTALSPARATACAVAMLAVLTLAMAGCAPKANDGADASAGKDEPVAVQVDFTWSETSDCALCHANEHASFDDGNCAASEHSSVACIECHVDATSLASAHEQATAERAAKAALTATAVDAATCGSCHALDEVAAATADVTALTDENGTVVNPHALPTSDDHAEVTCTSCHAMHASGVAVEKRAQRTCASCHHANVYECYTCHS